MLANACLRVDTVDTRKSVFLYLPGELVCVKVHEDDVTEKLDPKAAK